MKIVIIDNFDSFTHNLAHAIEQLSNQVITMRNNNIDWQIIDECDKIIFSPGPGLPGDVKIMGIILDKYKNQKAILGVCLGMQYIGIYFGGKIFNLKNIIHGIPKTTQITDKSEPLFQGLPNLFNSGRYHSWALSKIELPDCLKITATDNDGLIMAIRHKNLALEGVQFHPESIRSQQGLTLLNNFIEQTIGLSK